MKWKKRIRRGRRGICSHEKWGMEQRGQKRRKSIHENIIKSLERNGCNRWKILNATWWRKIQLHAQRPWCAYMHHSYTWTSCLGVLLCGQSREGRGLPRSQYRSRAWATSRPYFKFSRATDKQLVLLQDGRVLCTAVVSSHNALENISMASRGTICTSVIFHSEASLNYLKVQEGIL